MKGFIKILMVSILGGAITLGSYKLFFEDKTDGPTVTQYQNSADNSQDKGHHTAHVLPSSSTQYVSSNFDSLPEPGEDFTKAAQKTVNAVVHVKNVEKANGPRNMSEYLRGIRGGKHVRGFGSGVVITPDGYIVTNNHVIKGASELEVTLSNNKSYKAKVIGSDSDEDIALIKIDAEDLEYLPFGDSNDVKVGEWALAVGNPFNLTSTVTAGIISAKGRNLNEGGAKMQSFIQTDAAVNPGNSGGALVNTDGELIGINSAISSRTGSYIGYSFAVPSNNARKIVEDLMEYGDIKHAIIGVSGNTLDSDKAKDEHFGISQGVYVHSTRAGAKKAGLHEGDIIKRVDDVPIRKMSDLSSYIGTKRPDDKIQVDYLRDGEEKMVKVKLTEYESFALKAAQIEVTNAEDDYLEKFDADQGVRIAQTLSHEFQIPEDKYIIVAIDGHKVDSVKDVRLIMEHKRKGEQVQITFQRKDGQRETVAFPG